MIIPFEALTQLPKETLDNLIKEHLLTQVEDGSFSSLDTQNLAQATTQCMQLLKTGELLVEYSENDESIAIHSRQQIQQRTPLT